MTQWHGRGTQAELMVHHRLQKDDAHGVMEPVDEVEWTTTWSTTRVGCMSRWMSDPAADERRLGRGGPLRIKASVRSIVPTAVGTSHFHCTKCPQLWSDKFRPWSISAGGTPQSVLLYDGCYWICTQTEFSDLPSR
jgi:hypothetical protein